MKKLFSLILTVLLTMSTLLSFSFNAFANTQDKADSISLGQTLNETVDSSSSKTKYSWLKFDCLSSNYYDFTVFSSALPPSDVFLTVYDEANNVINSNVNSDNQYSFVSATYFVSSKTYYFRVECLKGNYSFSASLNIHNHNYTNVFAKAVADDDRESRLNGYSKFVCTLCGDEYVSKNIYAPSTVKLSASKFTFSPYGIYPSVAVYDSVGNLISPSEYTVTYDDNFKTGKAWVYVDFVGNNYKGELTSSFIIIPSKPTPTSLKSKKSKQITYYWNKDINASGYEIQYSTSSSFSKSKTKSCIISKNSTKSKTFSSLQKKKKYYVRMRSYKTIDGKRQFTSWSKKLSVKTK